MVIIITGTVIIMNTIAVGTIIAIQDGTTFTTPADVHIPAMLIIGSKEVNTIQPILIRNREKKEKRCSLKCIAMNTEDPLLIPQ